MYFLVYISAVFRSFMSLMGLLAMIFVIVAGRLIPFVMLIMSCWVMTCCSVLRSSSLNLSTIWRALVLSWMYFPHSWSNSLTYVLSLVSVVSPS